MKKVIAILSVALFVASCSKEDTLNVGQSNAPQLTTDSEGKLEIVNEPFTIGKGKASAQDFILRAVASAPVVPNGSGNFTNCTSVKVNSTGADAGKIYATWHTKGTGFGGAITSYDYDLTKSDETILSFISELRFPTVDMHEAALNNAGSRIYYVGQRNGNDGFYNDAVYGNGTNTGFHNGAVAGYVEIDGGTGGMTTTFAENALAGFAGDGIVRHDNNGGSEHFEVVTGQDVGYLYRLDASLNRVDSFPTQDGEAVAINNTSPQNIFTLEGNVTGGNNQVTAHTEGDVLNDGTPGTKFSGFIEIDLSSEIDSTVSLEKNNMIVTPSGDLLIADGDGLVEVNSPLGGSSVSRVLDAGTDIGGESRGVAFGSDGNVYLANGEAGFAVLDPATTPYSILGTWTGRPGDNLDAKDVFTTTDSGSDRFIFIANATGNLYIIEKL